MNLIVNIRTLADSTLIYRLLLTLLPLLLLTINTHASVQYNRDIRPLLSDKCFHCHGPDEKNRKAKLRLDTEEGFLADRGGYAAIVPGKPKKSELYKRITHKNAKERMPPQSEHKEVSAQEAALIYQWIKEGAQWQNHWSFEPILAPSQPPVKQSAWPKTPIDYFILSRLEKAGMRPSEPANRQTLIRRLFFDLTGLPPTYDQVQTFIDDSSDDAYEHLVDTLLASPSFGEHQAHSWLDGARYADTHGLHFDNYRSIWPYRDWVVNAFNQNKPFDEFTIEQLAGDLLPKPDQDQLVATGFTRSSPTTSEGGAIDEEYRVIYANDRTNTMATVWMGLTTGCAACHDHKFDPLSQKEFYQLTAFFRNTTESAMDGNDFDTRPTVAILNTENRAKKKRIEHQRQAKRDQLNTLSANPTNAFHQWAESAAKDREPLPIAPELMAFHLPSNDGKGNTLVGYEGGQKKSIQIDGKHKWVDGVRGKALAINKSSLLRLSDRASDYDYRDRFTVSFWLKIPKEDIQLQPIIGRIDIDPEDKGWWNWKSKTSGWFLDLVDNKSLQLTLNYEKTAYISGKLDFDERIKADHWHHFAVSYDGGAKQNSFQFYVDGKPISETLTKSLTPKKLAKVPPGSVKNPLAIGYVQSPHAHKENPKDKKIILKNKNSPFIAVQDIRVYNQLLREIDIDHMTKLYDIKSMLGLPRSSLSIDQKHLLQTYYAHHISPKGALSAQQNRNAIAGIKDLEKSMPVSLIMEEKRDSAPVAHVLVRGQYDQRAEQVASAFPSIFPSSKTKPRLNRLDLAQWLVHDDHPLTARVTVNRMWQSLFGRGIVETAGDFGAQGSPPTHPKLLDWLAHDFKHHGWDIKRAIKQIVMSATYQQSSQIEPHHVEKDPLNTLLSRSPRYRLGAEAIRDQVLHVSSLLVDKMGGPPVKPYQPQGLWKAVAYVGSNTGKFTQDSGEKLYRKSLYTYRKRTAPPPGMALFDAPDRESCVVRRDQTNTPLQALLLMNDPQFIEAARVLAEKIMKTSEDNKFRYLVEQTLGRTPDETMLDSLKSTYDRIYTNYANKQAMAEALISVGEHKADSSLDKITLATWTMLSSQMFNLDEFITKN